MELTLLSVSECSAFVCINVNTSNDWSIYANYKGVFDIVHMYISYVFHRRKKVASYTKANT